MDSKKACEKISKIEKKFFLDFYLENINLWPLIRLWLWEYFTNGLTDYKKNSKTYFFNNIFRRAVLNLNLYSFFNNEIKAKNIFFSKKDALSVLKEDSKKYDRVIDPIVRNTKKDLKVYYDSNLNMNLNLKYDKSRLNTFFELLPFRVSFSENFMIQTKKLCKENNIDHNIFICDVKMEVSNFFDWYKFGKKLFKKYSTIKKLYVYPWYSSSMMGLIAASKNYSILSYDIQHGVQGSHQAMYTHWFNVPKNGYEMVPTIFLVWNNITKKFHKKNNSSYFKKFHKSSLNKTLKFSLRKKIIKKNKIKTVLYCVQPKTLSNNETIPKFIEKFIKRKANNYLKFIIRVHPQFKKDIKLIQSLFKNEIKKNYLSIDDAKFSIYNTLENVSHCISGFSTTSVEASLYGVKSAVFGEDARNILGKYINKNKLILIDKRESSLDRWINS